MKSTENKSSDSFQGSNINILFIRQKSLSPFFFYEKKSLFYWLMKALWWLYDLVYNL